MPTSQQIAPGSYVIAKGADAETCSVFYVVAIMKTDTFNTWDKAEVRRVLKVKDPPNSIHLKGYQCSWSLNMLDLMPEMMLLARLAEEESELPD